MNFTELDHNDEDNTSMSSMDSLDIVEEMADCHEVRFFNFNWVLGIKIKLDLRSPFIRLSWKAHLILWFLVCNISSEWKLRFEFFSNFFCFFCSLVKTLIVVQNFECFSTLPHSIPRNGCQKSKTFVKGPRESIPMFVYLNSPTHIWFLWTCDKSMLSSIESIISEKLSPLFYHMSWSTDLSSSAESAPNQFNAPNDGENVAEKQLSTLILTDKFWFLKKHRQRA